MKPPWIYKSIFNHSRYHGKCHSKFYKILKKMTLS
nr:MAG TPA: hypothetical protein [Caudoviricetes sp.]